MPTSIIAYPGDNADDAHQQTSGSSWDSYDDMFLGNYAGNPWVHWIRFENVDVPQGAAISAAFIRWTSWSGQSDTTVKVRIKFVAEDNAGRPTSVSDLAGKTFTTAYDWDDVPSWGSHPTQQDSPDLSSKIQEIFDRSGWSANNHIVMACYDNGSGAGKFRQATAYDHGHGKAELHITYSGAVSGDITDAVGLSDEFIEELKAGLTAHTNEQIELSDSISAYSLNDSLQDDFSIDDVMRGGFEIEAPIQSSASINDLTVAVFEFEHDDSEAFSISDSIDAFNFKAWLTQYDGQLVTRYYFSLVDTWIDRAGNLLSAPLADVVIPISSFSCRRRNGGSSFLSVVIPDISYSAQIWERCNADMKLEVAYLSAGVEVLRETVIVVDLNAIRTDEGATNKSITLSGSRDETFGGQICTPRGINYKSSDNAKWLIRCQPDPYLRPGDTIRVDGVDLFVADYVSSWASGNQASMEVSES